MKTFHVYVLRHPMCNDYEAVKEGFCCPAFFFTWIWALTKGMLGRGVVILLIGVVLILGEIPGLLGVLPVLAVAVVIGAYGNQWYRKKLVKWGFANLGTVTAGSRQAAINNATGAECEAPVTLHTETEDEENS